MLRNYLKIAWRNISRNRAYTTINVLGLAIGMTCSFLIALWVWDELTYDSFHENFASIYQVGRNETEDGVISTRTSVPYPLSNGLAATFPEIKRACRVDWGSSELLTFGEKKLYQEMLFVDSTFLEMFTFRVLQGSAQTALDDPKSIVLSQKTATSLFGTDNPIGKIVRYDNAVDLKVTGVLANVPANSTFKFDFILPYHLAPLLDDFYRTLDDNWDNNMLQTFVQLHENTSATQLTPKIEGFLFTKNKDAKNTVLFLNPMANWRLYDKFENGKPVGGLIEYVRLFSGIAAFILLIACINFMNLATARSAKRAKEVGIRKAVGSTRQSLVFQFLGESNLLALSGFVVAVVLVMLLLPWFNEVIDKQLSLPVDNPVYWLIGLGITLLTGVLAGLYPAFYLSSFRPVRVLKGTLQTGKNGHLPRRLMVGLQFAFSIILLVSVIVVNQQLQYARNRTIGYDRTNLVMTDYHDETQKDYEALRQSLFNSGVVTSVGRTQAPITQIWNTNSVHWRPDKEEGIVTIHADYDYLTTFGIGLKQGRGFSRDFVTDSSAMLINESAARLMGFRQPLGEEVRFGERKYHIIGVVEDVLMGSPYDNPRPAGVFFRTDNILNKLTIRLKNGTNLRESLATVGQIFAKHTPLYPFDYQFIDAEYNKKFVSEERIGNLANSFALLAIFISCLGLLGLASYTAERRTKEIGVRKVLGASVYSIVSLLSREYALLAGISLLIASPVAWYFLNGWLQNFPYRISISWWVFAMAGLLTVSIALLTVSFQSIKAALMNPVKSLRSE